MKRCILLLLVFFLAAGFAFTQQRGVIYLEAAHGFNLGIGPGYYAYKDGAYDSTLTYLTTDIQNLGSTGFAGNVKVGYGVLDNLIVLLGVDFKMGWNKWTDANTWNADGSVLYEYSY